MAPKAKAKRAKAQPKAKPAKSKLTPKQRKELEPILKSVEKGLDKLAKKVSDLGITRTAPDIGQCLALRCHCQGYVRPRPSAPNQNLCARPGCGHHLFRHLDPEDQPPG